MIFMCSVSANGFSIFSDKSNLQKILKICFQLDIRPIKIYIFLNSAYDFFRFSTLMALGQILYTVVSY
jgi:hypothetical protein